MKVSNQELTDVIILITETIQSPHMIQFIHWPAADSNVR